MALFEFHVHNHVDTADILANLATIKAGVETLVKLATAESDADKAEIIKAATELDKAQSRIRASVEANPIPKP